jgi:hypothetical protein
MAGRNDITGDALVSKSSTDAYRDGWDRIFGNKGKKETIQEVIPEVTPEVEKKDSKE